MLAAFCLAACGARVNQANFDQVQPGMTLAQVSAILGDPVDSSGVDLTCKWQKGEATITVQFVGGKVVAKQLSKANRDPADKHHKGGSDA